MGSCYCEENVWHLCKQPALRNSFAVFISNEGKTVAVFEQKQCQGDEPVIWDYHVICVCPNSECEGSFRVFDLDSRLEWGVPFPVYAECAFRPRERLRKQYVQRFRVV